MKRVHWRLSEEVQGWVDIEGSEAMNSRVINTIISVKLKGDLPQQRCARMPSD